MDATQYDALPQKIKDILSTFDENLDPYKECKRIQNDLEDIGWDCDYDLSGTITEVTKNTCTSQRLFKVDCGEMYNCCDCGGNDCGCSYCFSCRACEVCLNED